MYIVIRLELKDKKVKIEEKITTKEIATQLFVSTRNIGTHRANILKKLDVKNTAFLIKKAAKAKLI